VIGNLDQVLIVGLGIAVHAPDQHAALFDLHAPPGQGLNRVQGVTGDEDAQAVLPGRVKL